jgi:hypothetical protein
MYPVSVTHTEQTKTEFTVKQWQVGGEFTPYLLFILYIGPDDGLINVKHLMYASEGESKLCFD